MITFETEIERETSLEQEKNLRLTGNVLYCRNIKYVVFDYRQATLNVAVIEIVSIHIYVT